MVLPVREHLVGIKRQLVEDYHNRTSIQAERAWAERVLQRLQGRRFRKAGSTRLQEEPESGGRSSAEAW